MATVLVVDDEWLIREELVANLEDAGFDVLQADNGIAALRTLRAHTPDVIVTDFMMPLMDGVELARVVRGKAHITTPIILRSAHRRKFQREQEKLFAGIYDKSDALTPVLDHVAALARTAECGPDL